MTTTLYLVLPGLGVYPNSIYYLKTTLDYLLNIKNCKNYQ